MKKIITVLLLTMLSMLSLNPMNANAATLEGNGVNVESENKDVSVVQDFLFRND